MAAQEIHIPLPPQEAGLDAIDRKILDILQADATVPVATIAEKVGLSAAPCWRRIKRMEDDGVIRRRVALIDRRKANVPMTLFVSVRTTRHAVKWLEDFRRVISDIPEIVEAWRLTGDIDYLLRIVVPDVDIYDTVYKRLINRLEFADISSAIAMEEMKYTTAIPTNYLVR
jgi:Lrp/AsnC family transcriptional regulator